MKYPHILLDTNIVIYALNKNPAALRFLQKYAGAIFYISMVTWIEALAGSLYHGKKITEIMEDLQNFVRLPINESVGQLAAEIIQDRALKGRRKHFQDSVIAATAMHHQIPLITNNPRDFRHLKKFKLISP